MLPELFLQLENGGLVRSKPVSSVFSGAETVLTASDRALIRLVAQGLPDRVLADRLGISEGEVCNALLSIFRKLALTGLLDQLLYSNNETEQIAC